MQSNDDNSAADDEGDIERDPAMGSQMSNQSTGVADKPDGEEAVEKLELEVKIEKKSACQRHITVVIPRADIDRYYSNAFGELMPKAAVPGFRSGRAPRKLVELRFHKEIAEQIKGSILTDSLQQVATDHNLAAISEPDFNAESVVVPEQGPMTFEFDIEVRPEFDLPEWKGLHIERPVKEFSQSDIDRQLNKVLAEHGRLVPYEGAAAVGDYLTLNLTFKNGEDVISSVNEETIRIRPVLSFRDGKVEGFGSLMQGVQAGETRLGEAQLSEDAPNEALRGKRITAVFEVLEVKKLEMPELTRAFLAQLGDFESEEELRGAVRASLQRRLAYEQQRRVRQQILAALTAAADWDLPPELLKRQSQREMERSILELKRSGFGEDEIRAHEMYLRQNSRAATARALKEHFILERIAEEENIEADSDDYDAEMALIAQQSGESQRRVRAKLEKQGMMDSLRNQVIERKAIDLILSQARFTDVPFEMEGTDAEALDQSAGGQEEVGETIPEAQHADEPAPLPRPAQHE